MSDIMFYLKVWVNNRILVYVFYQQEPTESEDTGYDNSTVD